ncbi:MULTISPECIES: DUF3667 domain-containing protein [Hymenobacter]|uniref:DUF3667 domain-containing protein n=2 Tax=Hymenobacter TaxID=89966 RepID=A0A7Y7PS97_9BACT|nr:MULTISPECIES: DUF3667 domain-containing protein [Hymenobacter]NVO33084.1 DUF3667 domain-containing protein [Hymenobacter lapidiphilus]OWP61404.1 hypothetical protein CDA63_19620 [Hymenobacter amundsenii]
MSFDYSSQLTAVVAAEALESAPGGGPPAQHACLDCGAALSDRFCAHCGQPADTHRITLKHLLLHDLPHSVWHVDKGLAFTFWQLLTRPGLTIRGYLAGQRTRQFRPVSYLLLLVGLSALVMSAFQVDLQQAMLSSQPTGAGSPSQGLMAVAVERYVALGIKHPSLMQLVILPLNALVAWLLLRRAGYNYAEVLLANAFIVGTLTVLNLAILLPALLVGNLAFLQVASQLIFIPTLGYTLWVNAQLLRAAPALTAARRYGRALGISLLQIGVLLLAIVVCVAVLTVQILRERPDLRPHTAPKKSPTAALR